MIRMIGAVMLTAGFAALGFRGVRRLDGRVYDLGQLSAGLSAMKRELDWRLTPLPELLDKAAQEAKTVEEAAPEVVDLFNDKPLEADAIEDVSAGIVTPSPVAEEEFCRVLKDGGRLIIAAAAPDHLRELKAQLYESVTENTERGDLPKTMKLIEKNRVSYTRTLHSGAIAALYGMTPYSRRTSREAAERLLGLECLEITFSFDIYVYGKKEQV